MKDIFTAVARFQSHVLGTSLPASPMRLAPERKDWAIKAFDEEVQEFSDANTIEEEADALADLVYYVMGRFYEMGVNPDPVFTAVDTANLKKRRGDRGRGSDLDAAKPEGWQEPRIPIRPVRKPKLLVIGHARHGKDTVSELLRDEHGFAFTSSSLFCAEHVIMPMTANWYDTVQECYEDRHNHRDFWHGAIQEFLEEDASDIGAAILAQNDIYCGIRSIREFYACRHLADHVVWVDARERLPLESATTMQLEPHMADTIIHNNGTLDELKQRVEDFVLRRF